MNIDLNTLADGALKEKFEHELEKVLENIQDLNTDHKTKRKLIVELTFVPNEGRDLSAISILTKTKLADRDGTSTTIAIGTDKDGNLITQEIRNQLNGQLHIDEETGEVIDNKKYFNLVKGEFR